MLSSRIDLGTIFARICAPILVFSPQNAVMTDTEGNPKGIDVVQCF